MFEQARKNVPPDFIDEIDAVAASARHVGLSGGNDEPRERRSMRCWWRWMGLYAGRNYHNRGDQSPGCARPGAVATGRFDRQITVNLPDVRGAVSSKSMRAT